MGDHHFAGNPALLRIPREKSLFLLLGIFTSFPISSYHYQLNVARKGQLCGALYAGPNSQGEAFPFNDQDQSPNLGEDKRAATTGWKTTGTAVVEQGCKFLLCNETYFLGHCVTFGHESPSMDGAPFLRNLASAECTCERRCQCSDIHVKRSSCGNAYLEGGCRTCNTLYTELSIGRHIFPQEFGERVTTFRLRKGCNLTIYENDELRRQRFFHKDIVEDFEGRVGSYKCECYDKLYTPSVPPGRSILAPEMIDIPSSMDDVLAMMRTRPYKTHPGLQAARVSFQSGRSTKNAYILVIGSTGSGKSTTINMLFDNPNVTKVGDYTSTTSHIHEFRIRVPVDDVGISNSELRVIDTPGIGDTRGMGHDAQFLATLDNYLANHEELKDRMPNVVLIFHKFNDNRFFGERSSFVKMIRAFDKLTKRITDEDYSNVIFVFTHFCSVPYTTKRRPQERLNYFKEVIEDHTLYPRPYHMVLAENSGKEHDLLMVNGYYKLPNREYYPRNLFEKLELVTSKGRDPIGTSIFTAAFRYSEDFKVTPITRNLMTSNDPKVEDYWNILSISNIAVVRTEISQHLEVIWTSQISAELRKKFPFSLMYLQRALNLRNINTIKDVPTTTPAIWELLRGLKHDGATRALLEKGLNITSPPFPLHTIAGYGYNILEDRPLPNSPFKRGDLHHSDIGFMIPTSLSCTLDSMQEEHFHVLKDKQEYLDNRLQNLGVDLTLSPEQFTGDVRPGSNILGESFKNDRCSLSATKDFRVFEFALNKKLELTREFQNALRALPPVNVTDQHSVTQWRQFFYTYGTHVVERVYGGGSIQINIESSKPFDAHFSRAVFDLLNYAEDLAYDTGERDYVTSSEKFVWGEETTQVISFMGGDPAYYFKDLSTISRTQAHILLAKWRKSLKFYPSMLTTKMDLVPLSQIVRDRRLGNAYVVEIEKATWLLFNSSLEYTPTPRPPSTLAPPTKAPPSPFTVAWPSPTAATTPAPALTKHICPFPDREYTVLGDEVKGMLDKFHEICVAWRRIESFLFPGRNSTSFIFIGEHGMSVCFENRPRARAEIGHEPKTVPAETNKRNSS